MKDQSRRSLVKTSAATGLTFTFAGLIRAHGQSGGGTTWNPEATFGTTWATDVSTTWNQECTYVATTWPGNETSTTWDPNGSYGETTNPNQEYTTTYDPNVYETTQPETIQTTEANTTAIPTYTLQSTWIGSPGDPYSEKIVTTMLSRRGITYELKTKIWTYPWHGRGNDVRVDFKPEAYQIGAGHPDGAPTTQIVGSSLDPSAASIFENTKSSQRCTLPSIYSPSVNVDPLHGVLLFAHSYEAGGADGETFRITSVPSWLASLIPPTSSHPAHTYSISYVCSLVVVQKSTKTILDNGSLVIGVGVEVETEGYFEEEIIYKNNLGVEIGRSIPSKMIGTAPNITWFQIESV